MTIAHLNRIILSLGTYFFILICCQRKLRDAPQNKESALVKVRRYAAHVIKFNKYLAVFSGVKESEKGVRQH